MNAIHPKLRFRCEPCHLALGGNAVHVWILDDSFIEEACAALAWTLSPDERQRASAYRRDQDRLHFIGRRGALRMLIGLYLDRAPESLRFQVARFGKLALQADDDRRLAFNMSGTDGKALLAFAWDCHVGVDVERIVSGMDLAGIASQIFSPLEKAVLDAAGKDLPAAFFSTWTRKEALLKALGIGLSGEPQAYTTKGDLRAGVGRWTSSFMDGAMTGWTGCDLDTDPHFRAALAVSLEHARVSLKLASTLLSLSA
jgi:4'-phosphopantetheinyl transferase